MKSNLSIINQNFSSIPLIKVLHYNSSLPCCKFYFLWIKTIGRQTWLVWMKHNWNKRANTEKKYLLKITVFQLHKMWLKLKVAGKKEPLFLSKSLLSKIVKLKPQLALCQKGRNRNQVVIYLCLDLSGVYKHPSTYFCGSYFFCQFMPFNTIYKIQWILFL